MWQRFCQNLAHNKRTQIIVALVAAFFIGGVAFALTRGGSDSSDNSQNTQGRTDTTTQPQSSDGNKTQDAFMQQYGQNCKERDVAFTSAPMRMNELAYIRPLGAMSDGHVTPTDHVYVGGSDPNAADNTYPVLMPADGTVTVVAAMPAQYIGDRKDQHLAPEDHRIVISHSCRYFSIFIHIHKLSAALKAEVGTLQPNQSKLTTLELKAGDTIGYIGNTTFDWTPVDTEATLTGFITPSLYAQESWKIHTVSPFDLYKDPLKSRLEAKSLRSAPPIGGKIDYDKPGRLIGNWFRQGSNGYSGSSQNRYWDGHLSVVPDYLDPNSTVVSIGNWQGSAKQLLVNGKADPAAVSATSGAIKYELKGISYVGPNDSRLPLNSFYRGAHPTQNMPIEGTILLQVMSGEKLKVETFPGKTAQQVSGFTGAAKIYER